MAHDIVIIIDRAEALSGSDSAGSIGTLKQQAVAAHNWVVEQEDESELRQAVHEWLEAVQSDLELAAATVAARSAECPMK